MTVKDNDTQKLPIANWSCFRLPPFSPVAAKIMKLVSDDDAPADELAKLISSEQAFASAVLTLANSAMYAHRFPVTDILPAINRLGLKNLQGLCMSVAMVRLLGKQIRSPRIENLWRHNLACGFIAETLATGTGIDQGTAFTCGLMHDVGRLALCVLHPDEYEHLLEVHQGLPTSILQVEKEMFGFDHCEAGHELVRSWSLPLPFDQAALMHHGPIGTDGLWNLTDLIGVSCKVADSAGFAAFPGCELTPYADLIHELPNTAMGELYPDVDSLASEIQGNIELMRIF